MLTTVFEDLYFVTRTLSDGCDCYTEKKTERMGMTRVMFDFTLNATQYE